MTLAFEQRTRAEWQTNRFRIGEAGPTRVLVLRTRLQLSIQQRSGPLRLHLELQDSRAELNDEPFVVEARHVNELDITQAHLQLAWDRTLRSDIPTQLQIGRFTMDLGKRRLSARNRMRNTTNTFDGVLWQLGCGTGRQLDTFVSRPVELKPRALDSSSNLRYFWGLHYQDRSRRRALFDAYYLGLHESSHTSTRRRHSTVGGRLYKQPVPRELDYEFESDWQLGSIQGRDHFAHHQHAEIGYVIGSWWDSRVSVHYDYASGDEEPDDERSGTFSTLFGARRFEFGPTGIYGPFFRSNIHTPGIRWALSAHHMVELMAAYRALWLAEARDAWVGSGLRDTSGNSGRFLGNHVEVRCRWKPLDDLLVETGYAHFFKGSYLDRVPESPRTADSDFLYVAVELRATVLRK